MNPQDVHRLGSAILALSEGDFPDEVTPEQEDLARKEIPREILEKKISSSTPSPQADVLGDFDFLETMGDAPSGAREEPVDAASSYDTSSESPPSLPGTESTAPPIETETVESSPELPSLPPSKSVPDFEEIPETLPGEARGRDPEEGKLEETVDPFSGPIDPEREEGQTFPPADVETARPSKDEEAIKEGDRSPESPEAKFPPEEAELTSLLGEKAVEIEEGAMPPFPIVQDDPGSIPEKSLSPPMETKPDIPEENILTTEGSLSSPEKAGDDIPLSPPPLETQVSDQEEGEHERAYRYLQTFEKENRLIVSKALKEDHLRREDAERVFTFLRHGGDQEEIVRFIFWKSMGRNVYGYEDYLRFKKKQDRWVWRGSLLPTLIYSLSLLAFLLFLLFGFYRGRKYFQAHQWYTQGHEAIERRSYVESEEYFHRAMEVWPRIDQCNRYAQAYIEQERYADAEKKYLEAIEMDSEHFMTRLNWAKLFILKGDIHRAEKELKNLLKTISSGKREHVLRELGRLYLSFSKVKPSYSQKAEDVYKRLLEIHPQDKSHHAGYLQAAVAQGQYVEAKNRYRRLVAMSEDYTDPEAYTSYLDFLIKHYRRDYSSPAPSKSGADEQLDVVRTIEDLSQKLYRHSPDHLPAYSPMTVWQIMAGEYERAEGIIDRGIARFQQKGSRLPAMAADLYSTKGRVLYKRGDVVGAMKNFIRALEDTPDHARSHYYMGRINFLDLHNSIKAKEHYHQAKWNWEGEKGADYDHLLHGLAYLSYREVEEGSEIDVRVRRQKLTQCLNYWMELADRKKRHYLLEYAIGNTYLRLGEFDLAQAKYLANLPDLGHYLDQYIEASGDVTPDIRRRIEVLSDIYNNLSVAHMARALKGERPRANTQKALECVIDAIELKNKLGLAKGIPQVNFNRINDARIRDATSLLVADRHLLRTMD